MKLEQKAAKLLTKQNKAISIAESCTGGLLSSKLTSIPGSSKFLKLGIVSYSNESKVKLLKVPKKKIDTYGAVSDQTARAMASGARRILKTDFGIGITGIAGPAGGTKNKPVGLTFVAISTKEGDLCLKCNFKRTRKSIREQASNTALKLLIKFLS
jgi:nicotinamide-nucleotide amidase